MATEVAKGKIEEATQEAQKAMQELEVAGATGNEKDIVT